MEKISYNNLVSSYVKPCQGQFTKFVKEFGKDASISYEQYKNLEWVDLSGIIYLYLYLPESVDKVKIEKNLSELLSICVESAFFVFPHPVVDTYLKELRINKFSLETLSALKVFSKQFSEYPVVFKYIQLLREVAEGEGKAFILSDFISFCAQNVDKDMFLLYKNQKMKDLT